MKRTREFTKLEIQNIINEYKDGERVIDLSKKHNVSPYIIYYWMNLNKMIPSKMKKFSTKNNKGQSQVISEKQIICDQHKKKEEWIRYLKLFCVMGCFYYIFSSAVITYLYFYVR